MKKELVKEIQAIIETERLNCTVEEFPKVVNWDLLSKNYDLSHDFLHTYSDFVPWRNVSIYQRLTPETIRKFADKLYWFFVCIDQQLTPELIREFSDKIIWMLVCIYQRLTPELIREFSDRVHWLSVSEYQRLTPGLIREFADKLNWCSIYKNQRLTPSLIRQFANKLQWNLVSKYQRLNDSLIREFKDRLNLDLVNKYQRIGPKLRRELGLPMPEDNWLYKSVKDKREYIKSLALYEFTDNNTIIAYKGIRKDRRSALNFRHTYLPGQIYTSHCDCTAEENSFGLAAWTEQAAREYCPDLVVPVEIKLRDIGRVLPDGKIRCRKLKILA